MQGFKHCLSEHGAFFGAQRASLLFDLSQQD
jgi:hypothetical protein